MVSSLITGLRMRRKKGAAATRTPPNMYAGSAEARPATPVNSIEAVIIFSGNDILFWHLVQVNSSDEKTKLMVARFDGSITEPHL